MLLYSFATCLRLRQQTFQNISSDGILDITTAYFKFHTGTITDILCHPTCFLK